MRFSCRTKSDTWSSVGRAKRTSRWSPIPYDRRKRRRSEEHTSELQSPCNLVCRLLLEKKKKTRNRQKSSSIYRMSTLTNYTSSLHRTSITFYIYKLTASHAAVLNENRPRFPSIPPISV